MNDLDRLRLERDAMIKQVAAAEAEAAAGRAREAFRILARPNVPVLEVIDQALTGSGALTAFTSGTSGGSRRRRSAC